jgi:hypothetical protein
MLERLKRTAVAALVVLVAGSACKSKPASQNQLVSASSAAASASSLRDLSTSLDAVRVAFNERKQEARFLALLSPT